MNPMAIRWAMVAAVVWLLPARALDVDADGLDDVWQQLYHAEALVAGDDGDGDGHSNAEESAAGTDPLDAAATFQLAHAQIVGDTTVLRWTSEAGKRYLPQISSNLVSWVDWEPTLAGTGTELEVIFPSDANMRYYRVRVFDADSDGDQVSDWAELQAGFNPNAAETVVGVNDLAALTALVSTPASVRLEVVQGTAYERNASGQPGPGHLRVVRTGGLAALTVPFTVTGRPIQGEDYQEPVAGPAQLGFGQNTVDFTLTPLADNLLEVPETLTVTLQAGPGYTLDPAASAGIRFLDEENGSEIFFYAPMGAADGATTPGSGYATLFLSPDHGSLRVSVSFSNLVAPQISAHLHHHPTRNIVESLELGQILNHAWTFPENGAGGIPSAQGILDAILGHEIYVNVHSTTYPAGEIEGDFHRADGSTDFTPPPAAAAPPAYTGAQLDQDVQRLIAQATFGQTDTLFATVKTRGLAGWIDDQMNTNLTPRTTLLPFVLAADDWVIEQNNSVNPSNTTFQPFFQSLVHAWWTMAVHARDQLRQRVAFALSEIFVVSLQNSTVRNRHYGTADYWDTLSRNAFGNFRTLLEDVTLHPIMASYLSMVQNEKYNPTTGVSPDENYAREVMQLFSIGLVELHPDGSLRLDGSIGQPIPTYDNTDITELAKVFTGWSFGKAQAGGQAPVSGSPLSSASNSGAINDNNVFGYRGGSSYGQAGFYYPLKMFAPQHETSAKTIVRDIVIPANQTGEKDLDDAMDALFNHPNTPSFIARRLIQRLVTSNPSRGYVYRVAQAFANNGSGVRGDLGAMVRAILLDPEARTLATTTQVGYGKMREPVLMMTHLLRALSSSSQIPVSVLASQGYVSPYDANATLLRFGSSVMPLGQTPLNAPSVFNWWHPDYSAPGAVAAAGLASPEFEIATETQMFNVANLFNNMFWGPTGANAVGGFVCEVPPGYNALQARAALSLTASQAALTTGGVNGLLDYLNGLLTQQNLSSGARAILATAVNGAVTITGSTQDNERIKNAVYLLLNSPDYMIQR